MVIGYKYMLFGNTDRRSESEETCIISHICDDDSNRTFISHLLWFVFLSESFTRCVLLHVGLVIRGLYVICIM